MCKFFMHPLSFFGKRKGRLFMKMRMQKKTLDSKVKIQSFNMLKLFYSPRLKHL